MWITRTSRRQGPLLLFSRIHTRNAPSSAREPVGSGLLRRQLAPQPYARSLCSLATACYAEGLLHRLGADERLGAGEVLAQIRRRPAADGVALDLGVSSMQLDEAERGFSFRADGPLDMRMGREGPSAADLVNGLPETELADILFRYGEEKRSRAIARAIIRRRGEAPITRTGELAAVVHSVTGPKRQGRGQSPIDPATRSFQALRIAVNDELGELDRGLVGAEAMLKPGGRLAVVSFHSLEDRRVKQFLRRRSGRSPQASRHLPAGGREMAPSFRRCPGDEAVADEAEVAQNPRARSARLRGAERSEASPWGPMREAA